MFRKRCTKQELHVDVIIIFQGNATSDEIGFAKHLSECLSNDSESYERILMIWFCAKGHSPASDYSKF